MKRKRSEAEKKRIADILARNHPRTGGTHHINKQKKQPEEKQK